LDDAVGKRRVEGEPYVALERHALVDGEEKDDVTRGLEGVGEHVGVFLLRSPYILFRQHQLVLLRNSAPAQHTSICAFSTLLVLKLLTIKYLTPDRFSRSLGKSEAY
jgi:hypothetical protein